MFRDIELATEAHGITPLMLRKGIVALLDGFRKGLEDYRSAYIYHVSKDMVDLLFERPSGEEPESSREGVTVIIEPLDTIAEERQSENSSEGEVDEKESFSSPNDDDAVDFQVLKDKLNAMSSRRESFIQQSEGMDSHGVGSGRFASPNAADRSVNGGPSVTGHRRTKRSSSTTSSEPRVPVTSAQQGPKTDVTEDLYKWMAREQETHKRKVSSSNELSGDVTVGEPTMTNGNETTVASDRGKSPPNLSHVPITILYEPMLAWLNLEKPKRHAVSVMLSKVKSQKMAFSFVLDTLSIHLLEPKVLKSANANLQRISHSDREVASFTELILTADSHEKPQNGDKAPKSLNSFMLRRSKCCNHVKHVNYHAHLSKALCNFGFSTAAWMNQMVFVARNTAETFAELIGKATPPGGTSDTADIATSAVLVHGAVAGTLANVINSRTSSRTGSLTRNEGMSGLGSSKLSSNLDSSLECLLERDRDSTQGRVKMRTPREVQYSKFPKKRRKLGSLDSRDLSELERGTDLMRNDAAGGKPHKWHLRLLEELSNYQRSLKSDFSRFSLDRYLLKSDEPTLLVVTFGVISISDIQIQAIMTELVLFGSVSNVQFGHSSKEKCFMFTKRVRFSDRCVSSAVQRASLNLMNTLKGSDPSGSSGKDLMQTVAEITVEQSQVLYTKILKSQSHMAKNSLLLEIGPVAVNIPLNPGLLHGMVRKYRGYIAETIDSIKPPRVFEEEIELKKDREMKGREPSSVGQYSRQFSRYDSIAVVHFCIVMRSLSITAQLLPSLKAHYKMDQAVSSGVTGDNAKFVVEWPKHKVTFDVRGLASEASCVTPTIQLSLPPVLAQGSYILDKNVLPVEGDIFKKGSYLKIEVEVGVFQHTLTTDLLNQLLFIEEAFMRELGEIVQKVTGEKKPPTVWTRKDKFMYHLDISVKNIQITATTPTATAMRLETDMVKFQLSNRLKEKYDKDHGNKEHLFGTAEISLTVALGQLVKDAMFEEVKSEFQQVAYFKTQIGVRNTPSSVARDLGSTAYLISLTKPSLFILPTAVDKAIVLWINYKNTYEFWNEQRQQIRARSPRRPDLKAATRASVLEHLGSPNFPTSTPLFFQIKVYNGIYACLPLNARCSGLRTVDDPNCALICSVEDTGIAVCTFGSLVSSGRFKGFCVRFVEDFDQAAEDWRSDCERRNNTGLNSCYVPEGTYKICSRTTAPSSQGENAEWKLNIQWEMKGVDMNFNTSIGKCLSLLASTLTSIAGEEEEKVPPILSDKNQLSSAYELTGGEMADMAGIWEEFPDLKMISSDQKEIERAMTEQATLVNDLISLKANEATIEEQRRKLQILESLLFRQFRFDMRQKLKKQSQKANYLKNRFGLPNVGTPSGQSLPKKTHRRADSSDPALTRKNTEIRIRHPEQPQSRLGHGRASSFDSNFPSPIQEEEGMVLSHENVLTSNTIHSNQSTSGEEMSRDELFQKFQQASLRHTASDVGPRVAGKLLERQSSTEGASYGSAADSKETTPHNDDNESSPGAFFTLHPGAATLAAEPSVNLYLDWKIYIDSGRCIFRSDENGPPEDEKANLDNKNRFGSSGSNKLKPTASGSVPKHGKFVGALPNETVIPIPGLNIESYYVSLSGQSNTKAPNVDILRSSYLSEEVIGHLMTSQKRAQFCLWCSLERMPEETAISPHILDFLEKTLEPLSRSNLTKGSLSNTESGSTKLSSRLPRPSFNKDQDQGIETASSDRLESVSSTPGGVTAWDIGPTAASFPVDVVLYISVHSSAFRFTSLPASRVQCLLKLPSLTLVATSRKSSDLYLDVQNKQKKMFVGSKSTPHLRTWSTTDSEGPSDEEMLSGGVSVTASLTDFSLFIFHPYGATTSALREGSLSTSPRKDSLSLAVTSVVVNMARSRNVFSVEEHFGALHSSGQQHRSLKNSVRFSLMIDIGTAAFKYDMRRLNEILSFPKAWYRRSILRRLFLGDEGSMYTSHQRGLNESYGSGLESVLSTSSPRRTRMWTDGGSSEMMSEENAEEKTDRLAPPVTFQTKEGKEFDRFVRKISLQHQQQRQLGAAEETASQGNKSLLQGSRAQGHSEKWEAVVLFAVNFSALDVQTNMGNTMGITNWLTEEAISQGHLRVDSLGNKNVHLSFSLGSSVLDSKGGMVGGNVNLKRLKLYGRHKETAKAEPQHTAGIWIDSSSSKVEWMGTTIFMGSVTNLDASAKDEWKIFTQKPEYTPPVFSTNDDSSSDPLVNNAPGSLVRGVDTGEVHFTGDLRWKSLEVMISNSTVSDLMKIAHKLSEFFEEAFTSGKRILLPSTIIAFQKEENSVTLEEGEKEQCVNLRFHRHWQKPMETISKLLVYMKYPFPKVGMVLGGTFRLKGNTISLACFHGSNFRSQKWAVFHLTTPTITFGSEAKDVITEGRILTEVHQSLDVCLGNSMVRERQVDTAMALVLQVERGAYIPPQVGKIEEWFQYTFASVLQTIQGANFAPPERPGRNYRHTIRTLFRFPSLQMQLFTSHLQDQDIPGPDDPLPVVKCTFVADFNDHLLVSADVEALYFLHELINSFIREKQRPSSTRDRGSLLSRLQNPTEELQKDGREFVCNTWHMEPTVRFLDMAQIEPYGIDSILQKLGFKHARTTIPKWIQRGFMDPLDSVLAFVLNVIIDFSNKEKDKTKS